MSEVIPVADLPATPSDQILAVLRNNCMGGQRPLLDELAARLEAPAVDDVLRERRRQIVVKGYTPDHDDQYAPGVLAGAAIAFIIQTFGDKDEAQDFYPWGKIPEKLDGRGNLIKGAALLLAEIEHHDRVHAADGGDAGGTK